MNEHEYFMSLALEQAKIAYEKQEVPIGAIICHKNEVIGTGYNQVEEYNNACMHAEIQAIKQASLHLNSWRLNDCILYVTKEPCIMCTGAIINSRISTIYFAVSDTIKGGISSINIKNNTFFAKNVIVCQGILEKECLALLQQFFQERR